MYLPGQVTLWYQFITMLLSITVIVLSRKLVVSSVGISSVKFMPGRTLSKICKTFWVCFLTKSKRQSSTHLRLKCNSIFRFLKVPDMAQWAAHWATVNLLIPYNLVNKNRRFKNKCYKLNNCINGNISIHTILVFFMYSIATSVGVYVNIDTT